MQKILANTQLFSSDQRPFYTVEYWDTPFTVLEGDEASGGIITHLRNPKADGTWTLPAQLKAAATNTDITSVFASGSYSAPNIVQTDGVTPVDGRTDNIVAYWSAGAPGHHGATVNGKVGYHFQGYLRSMTGRGWFSSALTPTWFLAVAGQGYLRIDKKVGGTTTTIFRGTVSEDDFIRNGFKFLASTDQTGTRGTPIAITDMGQGARLDIYYVQDSTDPWGGLVVKAVLGDPTTMTEAQRQAAARTAPVLGCGLIDDGTIPTKRTLDGVAAVETSRQVGSSGLAEFELPLINMQMDDAIGWEWYRVGANDPGVLRQWTGAQTPDFSLKRQRLVRIKGGFLSENAATSPSTFTKESYPLFVGMVDDFDSPSDGVVVVSCKSFEQRLLDRFDKNYPDKISYMSRGYNQLEKTTEPIYEVPAFDAWPLEYAIAELMTRAGVDASRLVRQLPASTGPFTAVTSADGSAFNKFRARTIGGKLLMLSRPVQYGNAGRAFVDTKPLDDRYSFTPDNGKEIWQRVRDMSERYGYDCYFDETGDLRLLSRSVPHAVYELVSGDGGSSPSALSSPSAYAGTFLEYSGSSAHTVTRAVRGARIDVCTPRGPNYGSWTVKVKQGAVVLSTVVIPTSTTATSGLYEHFYDYRTTVDGKNSTVTTVYSGNYDDYTVEFTATADGAPKRLDSILVFHSDPEKPALPSALSTSTNALSVSAKATIDDLRNAVTVVGRRKATVTDSEKFKDNNPSNPAAEFVVESAVDAASVLDPNATNFIGYPKESIIIDSNITDNDFAAYIARTFIFRQRMPRPSAPITHTLLPVVQLRDPVYAVEDRFQTITASTVLFVSSYKHRFDGNKAITSIETTSYQEFPSYEPREDIDISVFGNIPVANVQLSYTSLTGHAKVNPGTGAEHRSEDSDVVTLSNVPVTTSSGVAYFDLNGLNAPWPPVPGTVQIKPSGLRADLAAAGQTMQTIHFIPTYDRNFTIVLPNVQKVVNINAVKKFISDPQRTIGNMTFDVNYSDSTVTVHGLEGAFGNIFQTGVQLTIDWVQGYQESNAAWLTNTPNHHFFEVDYRCVPQQENLLKWSEDFQGSGWSLSNSATIGATGLTAPDGSATASRLDCPGPSPDGVGIFQALETSFTGTRAVSVWLRSDTPCSMRLGGRAWSENADVVINVTASWQRFEVPQTYASQQAFFTLRKASGDTTARQIYLWGAQVNTGSTAYAYTKTTGAPVTGGAPLGRRIYLPWKHGDGSADYQLNTDIAGWDIRYRRLGPVDASGVFVDPYSSGASPFYDPYSSELGSLVQVKFDAMKSALYRIAVKSAYDDTTVAYLTNTNADPSDPEAHWQFMPAGANKTLLWDGVDQVGAWNQRQSAYYGSIQAAAFGQDSLVVGKGFYAWNQEFSGSTYPDLALIAGTRDATTGAPVFGQGTYARWYLAFESKVDSQLLPLVQTKGARTATETSLGIPETYVYTHLPEPTKVAVSVADWTGAVKAGSTNSDYDDTYTYAAGDWSTTPDTDATINNYKPVRLRFAVQPRPGTQWTNKQESVSIRVTRHAHVKALIYDQLVTFAGSSYPKSSTEKRVVLSRRMHSDDSEKLTYTLADSGFRVGSSFRTDTRGGSEWVFLPKNLKNNFRGIDNEELKFADYLQLEELPMWNTTNKLSGSRARIQLAFMGYLFYLSAYTQDRSGRYVWCVNPSFVDKAKIVKNASTDWGVPASESDLTGAKLTSYALPWPEDMITMQRRSVFVRQWTNEGATGAKWVTQQENKWSLIAGSIGEKLLAHKWHSHAAESTSIYGPNGTSTPWSNYTSICSTDPWTEFHVQTTGDDNNPKMPAVYGGLKRQLGSWNGTTASSVLGNWSWETAPVWIPNITRDFHGYYQTPVTADTDEASPYGYYRRSVCYTHPDSRKYANDKNQNEGSDVGANSGVWTSCIWDMTETDGSRTRFWPGRSVVLNQYPVPKDNVWSNMLDYERQENGLVHYEQLRNCYTRGPRPSETPQRLTAPAPYYINTFRYSALSNRGNRNDNRVPLAQATVADWFRVSFRHEYVYESAGMFPSTREGVERLEAYNVLKTRFLSPAVIKQEVFYDDGAWTGWKDDKLDASGNAPAESDAAYSIGGNVFNNGYMPLSVGPRLSVSRDVIFHMTLLNERRLAPVAGV